MDACYSRSVQHLFVFIGYAMRGQALPPQLDRGVQFMLPASNTRINVTLSGLPT
jgi:hypothetical protein